MLNKQNLLSVLLLVLFFNLSFSQKKEPKIIQDNKLVELIKLKKDVNIETFTSGQLTIQIFSGNYEDGLALIEELKEEKTFEDIYFNFETPYYKIRIGKFVSKLDAIKNLKQVKEKYSSAFILRPN
mgnify:CR=1 FL=1